MKKLRERLYTAQFHMQKADRVIYGTPLMNASGEALGCFVLAFLLKEDKAKYMDACIAWFTRLRVDLEFCVQENIIHFAKRKPKGEIATGSQQTGQEPQGEPAAAVDPRDAVSTQKVELFRLVAKIDGDMCKWRASLAKGKTVCE